MEDGSPGWLLLLFILCLIGSFYFAGVEMAFASVNRIRMRSHADNGDRKAKRVLYILDHFGDALTTILIGNNIVNISAATIVTLVATRLWGAGAVGYATVFATLLMFLLTETLPKSLAKACNERFAMATAASLLFFMRALRPLAFVFTRIAGLFRRRQTAQPTVTEDELFDIIEDAVEEGALDEETGELVHSAMQYTNVSVRDILTPWKQVLKLPLATPREAALAIIKEHGHSRIPVVDDTGVVVGLLHIRKYLKAALASPAPIALADAMDPVHVVRDNIPIDALLPEMSNNKTHFTIVQDEWENVLGIVTVEDILETLVGEIYDEEDAEGGDADAR
jgi:CBS domain containing-hemolysin-like protein